MGLLAFITWSVGRVLQNLEKKSKKTLQEKKG
jgi:hypothetical protein